MNESHEDLTQTLVRALGSMLIDVLASVPDRKESQKAKDEAQVLLVGLGNLSAMQGRGDLRSLLYDLSDRTGGQQRT